MFCQKPKTKNFFFSFDQDTGKLYCYGLLDSSNIKSQKKLLRPILISENIAVRVVKCGTSFIVFVNGKFMKNL